MVPKAGQTPPVAGAERFGETPSHPAGSLKMGVERLIVNVPIPPASMCSGVTRLTITLPES
jgi:hypothetical protein